MSLTTAAPQLHAEALTIGYEQRVISENLNVRIPEGKFTVIVGPNACGKSTLLRALARLIKPRSGQVLLDGKSVTSLPAKELARLPGCSPSPPSPPTASRSLISWPAAGTRTRNSCGSGVWRTSPR